MSRVIAFASALLFLALPTAAYAKPVNPVPAPSVTFNGPVWAAAIWGEVVYVGGDFTSATVNGVRYNRQRLAALGRTSGALLDWTPSADVLVTAVAADATGVYVGGNFAYVNGVKRDSLAKLDLGNGSLLPLSHKIYGHINTIAAANGRLYAGGTISSVDGVARKSVAAFNATTGALDGGWAPVVNGTVNAILPTADRVYLAGKF